MRFISDKNTFDKIKDLAKSGDTKAQDFLFSFMEMSDEDANAYLSSIAVDEKKIDITGAIEFLIKDENEAIDGYDRAIKLVENSNITNKVKIISVLNDIKKEELKHIKELKEIL